MKLGGVGLVGEAGQVCHKARWRSAAGCRWGPLVVAWRRWLPLEAPPTEEEDVQVEDSLSLDLGGGCGGV